MSDFDNAHKAIQEMLDHSTNASLYTWLNAHHLDNIDQSRANAACHLVSMAISALAAAREIYTESTPINADYSQKRLIEHLKNAQHNVVVAKSWLKIEGT